MANETGREPALKAAAGRLAPHSLLQLDPDLGNDLSAPVWRSLRETIPVDVRSFATGAWSPEGAAATASQRVLALLVIEGLLIREVQIAGRTSAELFGAGDLIHPPAPDDASASPLGRWKALASGRVALLDGRALIDATQALPLLTALADRSIRRGRYLATLALTVAMRRTDERLVFLLQFLASRWGFVRADGIRLTLPVDHETLARLIGTRRQSVTTALAHLRAQGLLKRLPDGDWLLAYSFSDRRSPPSKCLPAPTDDRTFALLDLDPRLAAQIPAEQRALARRRIRARVRALPHGTWHVAGEYGEHRDCLGLLVISGFLARTTRYRQEATLEIVGPGDLIRPWDDLHESLLLNVRTSWQALLPTELAVLDERLMRQARCWPAVTADLLARAARRARWLAVRQAISQQPKLCNRLIYLFSIFAERWGTGPDRLTVPIPLTHAQIGELVGAQRPSVSAALGELRRERVLYRLPTGAWRLADRQKENR